MIEVKNLTKRYGSNLAIDDLNFTVSDGEIVGFLGPNGAGKTTTMNIMTGYLSPTEGTVVINGKDILDDPIGAKMNIGYLPDVPPLYGNMFVEEYLEFVCDIKKVKKAGRAEHLNHIMETVKISEVKQRILKNLSKGYRQRVGLAQAMIGSPDVIILDEPSSGLDPKQIIEMREVIKELGKKHTVILSSHILSEVSAVCSRIIIINKGKIVASGEPDKLSASLSGNHNILLRVKGGGEDALKIFEECPDISSASIKPPKEEGTADIEVSGKEGMDIREKAFKLMAENGITVLMLKPLDLTLEETFLKITADSSRIDVDTVEEYEEASLDNEKETEEAVSEIEEGLMQENNQEEDEKNDGNN